MELTEFDIVILITMSMAVVSMSFVFPALGLGGDNVSESEIPEFNITSDRFALAGDFPDSPATPTSGTMDWNGSMDAAFSNNQIWLNGGTSGGYELILFEAAANNSAQVLLNQWENGNVTDQQSAYFNDTGQARLLEVGQYDVTFESTGYEVLNASEGTISAEIEYQIVETPITDGGWLDRIPVVGGIVEATEVTAASILWLGSIFVWFAQTTVETALNVIFVLVDTLAFFFSLATWLTSTYGGIVSGADSWVAVFISLPGILLTIVLGKLAFIGVSLLPTT